MALLQHRILAVLVPQDPERMNQLRSELLTTTDIGLKTRKKEEFENMLMRSPIQVLMQVKDYHAEERKIEVRTTPMEGTPWASQFLVVS